MMHRALLPAALCLAVSTSALAQVKLEYKFKEGRETTLQTTTKVKQTLTLKGFDVVTAAEEAVTATTKSGRRGEDGTLPIQEKIGQLRTDLDIMGMKFSYDTADPNAKIDLPQLAFLGDVLKALAGAEYTLILDKENKVKDVQGLDAVLDKAKDLNPAALDLLKDRLTTERMAREFAKAHGNLPNILVRPGEPWEQTEEDDIGGGQTLTFRRKYEYLGTVERQGKTLDKIGITALDVKYAMDPESKSPLKPVQSDLKVADSRGEMLFDREEGNVVERSSVVHITGTIDFKAGDQDIPSKLDLTLDTKTETEPKK